MNDDFSDYSRYGGIAGCIGSGGWSRNEPDQGGAVGTVHRNDRRRSAQSRAFARRGNPSVDGVHQADDRPSSFNSSASVRRLTRVTRSITRSTRDQNITSSSSGLRKLVS